MEECSRQGNQEATTVFIVAASDVARAGLESLIAKEARFIVAGSAADLSELAAEGAERGLPDVVVLDAERENSAMLAAMRSFIEEAGDAAVTPAFVVIGSELSETLMEALRAGVVRALLPPAASGNEIAAAVAAVALGLFVLNGEVATSLLSPPASLMDELRGPPPADERRSRTASELDALTPREREVLEMLAEGLSNKEIAGRLKISEHTVKFHVASIFAKLDVSTRTEAVMQGIRRGFVLM